MISLSKIIKSHYVQDEYKDKYVIQVSDIRTTFLENTTLTEEEFHQERFRVIEEKERRLEEKEQEIATCISNARMQIDQERQEWLSEKEILIQQTKKEAYSIGKEEGRQQGYNEYHSLVEQAVHIVELSKQEYDNHLASSDKAILKIGIKVAERILNDVLTDAQEAFIPLVKKVVKEVQNHQYIHIRVHPEKYPLLLSFKEELCELLDKDVDLYMYPDEKLQINDCLIDSSFGRIDASVDTQLAEMKVKLLDLMEEKYDEY
jgi:flagellar assembly protein FliH